MLVKNADSALHEREDEVSRLSAKLEQTEHARQDEEVRRKDLETQLQSLTDNNRTMRTAHQTEVCETRPLCVVEGVWLGVVFN